MTEPITLQIVLGENNARKLSLPLGQPASVEELGLKIKEAFGVEQSFRLQYQDKEFGNEFMNLSDIGDVCDKATLKIIWTMDNAVGTLDNAETGQNLLDATSISSDDTDLILPEDSPSVRLPWPPVFTVPNFGYHVELQLEKANKELSTSGAHFVPPATVKSLILQGLAEEILRYKAYPNDDNLSDVAEALVRKHPCLREQGSVTGFYGRKISLKYKMANFRTRLRGLGCLEVMLNALKTKAKAMAAFNIKKPKRAEVNFCPNHQKGETDESLENERISLLSEIKKRNNDDVISSNMDKTFSYRRKEILQGQPLIADFKGRCPALFTPREIDKEFFRIST